MSRQACEEDRHQGTEWRTSRQNGFVHGHAYLYIRLKRGDIVRRIGKLRRISSNGWPIGGSHRLVHSSGLRPARSIVPWSWADCSSSMTQGVLPSGGGATSPP